MLAPHHYPCCGEKHPGRTIGAKQPGETTKSCLNSILMPYCGGKHTGEAIDAKPTCEIVEVLHQVRLLKSCLDPNLVLSYGEKHTGEDIDAKQSRQVLQVFVCLF